VTGVALAFSLAGCSGSSGEAAREQTASSTGTTPATGEATATPTASASTPASPTGTSSPAPATSAGGVSGGQAGGSDAQATADAQYACVYGKDTAACDKLVEGGLGAGGNYGLGNSLTSAPGSELAQRCLATAEKLACAELAFRGPGGSVDDIATAFVTAYMAGNVAAQRALAGPAVTEISPSAIAAADGTGLNSLQLDGDGLRFSWSPRPTFTATCIVSAAKVQYCVVAGD
jgi:hypothetical protein